MGEIANALRHAQQIQPTPSREASPSRTARDPAERAVLESLVIEAPRPFLEEERIENAAQPQHVPSSQDGPWKPAQIGLSDPKGVYAHSYRRLAFRIREITGDGLKRRSIVVTSAQSGDGKTTTACNLALELTRLDQSTRVVLVDFDVRRPSLASVLGVEFETPVEAVVCGHLPTAKAIVETDVSGLSLVGSMQPAADVDLVMSNPNLGEFIRDLEHSFDWVVIDTPPVLSTPDPQMILRHASKALFIVRAGVTPMRAVQSAIEFLPASKLIGCFLNSCRDRLEQDYYGSRYYAPTRSGGQEAGNEGAVVDQPPSRPETTLKSETS